MHTVHHMYFLKHLTFFGQPYQLQVIFHLKYNSTQIEQKFMFCHSVHTLLTLYKSVYGRGDGEVGLALIIRFALETFPVISIYHLAKASISERPRLYLLFSYSRRIVNILASLLSLSLSPKCCGHICIPGCLNNAPVAC